MAQEQYSRLSLEDKEDNAALLAGQTLEIYPPPTASSSKPVYSQASHRRNVTGWIIISTAAEIFAVVSLALFIPVCLEQTSADNPGSVHSVSFALYVTSISVLLQFLVVISLGTIADDPRIRRRLLLCMTTLGSISAVCIPLLSFAPTQLLPATVILPSIIASVTYGVAAVCINAYLPGLARESSEVLRISEELSRDIRSAGVSGEGGDEDDLTETNTHESLPMSDPSIRRAASLEAYDAAVSSSTSHLSSIGVAFGFLGGVCVLLLVIGPVYAMQGSTISLKLVIAFSGICWGLISVPAAFLLPAQVESELKRTPPPARTFRDWLGDVVIAWRLLGDMLTIKEIRRLPSLFALLGAWFMLSDGTSSHHTPRTLPSHQCLTSLIAFTTIISTEILFAKVELGMSATALILIGVLTPLFGCIGAVAWPRAQKAYGWTSLQTLILLIFLASSVPAYGCLGFLPFFAESGFGGLTSPGEMYALAIIFGESFHGAILRRGLTAF